MPPSAATASGNATTSPRYRRSHIRVGSQGRLPRRPKSEVQAQVVLRVVARAARGFADLHAVRDPHRDPGADGRAVRSPAHALAEGQPPAVGVSFRSNDGVSSIWFATTSTRPSLSKSPQAQPRLTSGAVMPAPAWSETSRKRTQPKLRYRIFRCLYVQCNRPPSKCSPASHPRHIQASGEWHAESVWRAKRSAAPMGVGPLPGGCWMSLDSIPAVAGPVVAPVLDSAMSY